MNNNRKVSAMLALFDYTEQSALLFFHETKPNSHISYINESDENRKERIKMNNTNSFIKVKLRT